MASVEPKKRKKAHEAKKDAEQAATGDGKAAAAEALVPRAIMLQVNLPGCHSFLLMAAQDVQSAHCAHVHSWLQEQPTRMTTEAEQPAKKPKSKKRQAEAGAGAPATNGVEQPAAAVTAAKSAKLKRKKQHGLAAEPAAETMADTAEPSKQKKKQKASKQVPESSTLPLPEAVAALTAPGTAPAKEKKGKKRSRAADAQAASVPEAAGPATAGAQPASVPEAAVPAAALADGVDKKVKKRRKKAEGDKNAAPALGGEAAKGVPELKLTMEKRKVCSHICMLATVSGHCWLIREAPCSLSSGLHSPMFTGR